MSYKAVWSFSQIIHSGGSQLPFREKLYIEALAVWNWDLLPTATWVSLEVNLPAHSSLWVTMAPADSLSAASWKIAPEPSS